MKNLNQPFLCAMVIAVAILTISCSKDKMDSNTTNIPLPVTAGGIVDLGIVNGDVHHMSLSLTGVLVTMPGDINSVTQKGINVSMELFSKTDGVISNGEYVYSDGSEKVPNTFKSGALYLSNQELNIYNTMVISAGTVNIMRIGTSYTITMDGSLSSGEKFTGHFSGVLSYMDTEVPY